MAWLAFVVLPIGAPLVLIVDSPEPARSIGTYVMLGYYVVLAIIATVPKQGMNLRGYYLAQLKGESPKPSDFMSEREKEFRRQTNISPPPEEENDESGN